MNDSEKLYFIAITCDIKCVYLDSFIQISICIGYSSNCNFISQSQKRIKPKMKTAYTYMHDVLFYLRRCEYLIAYVCISLSLSFSRYLY